MKKSPFVLANQFKVSDAAKAQVDLSDRDEIRVFDNSFIKKYKLSDLFKFYSYGVRPTKLKKGEFTRSPLRNHRRFVRLEVS